MGFIGTLRQMKDSPATIYAVPLAGIMAGAITGRLLCTLELPTRLLKEIGGSFLGPIISNCDNLTLAGGLSGLAVSTALVAWRVKKNKQQINTD